MTEQSSPHSALATFPLALAMLGQLVAIGEQKYPRAGGPAPLDATKYGVEYSERKYARHQARLNDPRESDYDEETGVHHSVAMLFHAAQRVEAMARNTGTDLNTIFNNTNVVRTDLNSFLFDELRDE